MTNTRTRIGVIGCGNISPIYLQAGQSFEILEVAACADIDLARAKARAAEFHIPKACSVEELLADPEIEIVVNLTIPNVPSVANVTDAVQLELQFVATT